MHIGGGVRDSVPSGVSVSIHGKREFWAKAARQAWQCYGLPVGKAYGMGGPRRGECRGVHPIPHDHPGVINVGRPTMDLDGISREQVLDTAGLGPQERVVVPPEAVDRGDTHHANTTRAIRHTEWFEGA